jgi:hypothetical protein
MSDQAYARILVAREKTKQALASVSTAHLRSQVPDNCGEVTRLLAAAFDAIMGADYLLELAADKFTACQTGKPDSSNADSQPGAQLDFDIRCFRAWYNVIDLARRRN